MALGSPDQRDAPRSRPRWSALALGFAAVVVVALAGLVVLESKPSLERSSTALAKIDVPAFAGTLTGATAVSASGRPVPLVVHDGHLMPKTKLTPGELVRVDVVVRRPGWLSWALGGVSHEQLTVRAPVAQVRDQWLTLAHGASLRVSFNQPVTAVATGSRDHLVARTLRGGTLVLGPQSASAGSVEVEAAVRSWERLGAPSYVTWFPPSRSPVLVASPAAATALAPTAPIRLTFSQPVASVLGSSLPTLEPHVAGSWNQTNSHTLTFTPSGVGFPLASAVQIELPRAVSVSQPPNGGAQPTKTVAWSVADGSTLRLEQLLAQQGYLPVSWTPAGAPVAQTAAAETAAALEPPGGAFSWRYANTPSSLEALWRPGQLSEITKGAVMMFEHEHDLAVDGIAGPEVWHALLRAAIAGQRQSTPYSYVYVHAEAPESLTLWSGGRTVLTSPSNTGIPESPTQHGTFAVFEHIPVGTMSGTNPDGSHYHDPGIRYISYFNGGDAIHEFPRASYGTPQSLGCVELPLSRAAEVWPYTPIGTLVTIEN
jgi:peptidoglycan hydrolase-like protein with peptidoglycan-binding domain